MKVQELVETNLLETMDFSSDQEREDFVSQYSEILFARVIDRVSPLLEPQQLQKVTDQMDADAGMSEIITSLNEYVPHLPIILGEESLDLKEETLELVTLSA